MAFEELYDLKDDPFELTNLANRSEHATTQTQLTAELARLREAVANEQVV